MACMSGSFKCIFVHGVLSAFAEGNLRASAYAATSFSALPAAYAAIGKISDYPAEVWVEMLKEKTEPGKSMSHAILQSNSNSLSLLKESLFEKFAARLIIACSLVKSDEAAAITQGVKSVTLGRRLLIHSARNNAAWKNENLELHLYDTLSSDPDLRLQKKNLEEVLYATTRMLHAWPIPAEVDKKPYVDGSYTCLNPVSPLVEQGYKKIIAIATEPGPLYRDLFSSETIPSFMNQSEIDIIQPESDLKNMGVDFTTATEAGLLNVYQYGIDVGKTYINKN